MNNSVRVLPLLVVAGICLLGLKAMGLLFSGGYVVTGVAPAKAQDPKAAPASQSSPAGQEAAAKDKKVDSESDKPSGEPMTTANSEKVGEESSKAKKPKENKSSVDVASGPVSDSPKSELAVLEGLSNRRKDLDAREQKIDLRENLLRAAEKRVEARITELKTIQAQIEGELKKRDDVRQGQYDNLVKMYSAMKPKEAARIFDRMEIDILTGLASQIKPRTMSAIMAKMTPETAERLTLEMATRGKAAPKAAASLPKIESKKAN